MGMSRAHAWQFVEGSNPEGIYMARWHRLIDRMQRHTPSPGAQMEYKGSLDTDKACRLLRPFRLDFGVRPQGGPPVALLLALSNPGALPAAWELASYDAPDFQVPEGHWLHRGAWGAKLLVVCNVVKTAGWLGGLLADRRCPHASHHSVAGKW
jgi:hypothetical protein